MKKVITLLLTLLMFVTLVGCKSAAEEEPVIQEEEVKEIIEDTPVLGGWKDVDDGTLNDDLKNIFNSALEGLLGANYEPIELLATQVVNGTNYKFLASGTKTTNPIIEGTYNIIVNKSSDGTISLVDIEVVEEKEKKKEVDKSMNYWVVFYNPDGLELDRQAIKYGTTPTYKGEDPIYWDDDYWYRFICWTDKQGNEIKEFTPITGNTYIYAKYEIGGKAKKEESNKCTVIFNASGDTSMYPSITVDKGSKISDPSSGDYTWKLGGVAWDFDNDVVTSNITLDGQFACLAEGTMITMADGSKRAIETLNHGDLIKTFDHSTGKVSNARIMDYWEFDEPKSGLIILHFSNDIDVRIVDEHAFYCQEENTYVCINRNNISNYINKHFYNADNDNWETLNGATITNDKVKTYYLATEDYFNCVAEGMLNVEDGVYLVLSNAFKYDDDMKIDAIQKFVDIIRYGLFTHKDFDYLTKEEFTSHKLAYLKVALGKELITEKDLSLLEDIWIEEKEILEDLNN